MFHPDSIKSLKTLLSRFAANEESSPAPKIPEIGNLKEILIGAGAAAAFLTISGSIEQAEANNPNRKEPTEKQISIGKLSTESLVKPEIIGVKNGGRVFSMYDLKSKTFTPEDNEFLSFIFQEYSQGDIESLKRNSLVNSPADPTKIVKDEVDKYFLIWNTYREAENSFNFHEGFKMKNADLFFLNSQPKTAEVLAKIKFAKQELELQKELAKREQKAERLLIILSVLNRSLSKKFPKDIAENILKRSQYSWTNEDKFPAQKKVVNFEKISFSSMAEIDELLNEFVMNKPISESKKIIATEVAKLLNISVESIPTEVTHYSGLSILPDGLNKQVSTKAVGMASTGTLGRLNDQLSDLMNQYNNALKAGGHVFSDKQY